jgi:tetratricopeptide (TPR) repeat protein
MASPENIKRGIAAFTQAQQLRAQNRLQEAAAAFQRAAALIPDHPQLLHEYGQFAEQAGDYRTAERLYRRIGELRPDSRFEGRLAIVLFQLQKYAEAVPYFEAFIRQPQHQADPNPDMLHGLCNALCMCGRWEEGLVAARAALAVREDVRYRDAELNALYHLGRVDELDACIDAMLAKYPDSREIRSLYALHHLKSGDYRNGFRYFADLRWRNELERRRGTVEEFRSSWDGSPFDGVLIVTAEQGLGDEIMLSSLFDDLVATGQRAVIECDDRLLPLYRRSYPQMEFMPRGEKNTLTYPAGTEVRSVTALDLANVLRNGIERFPTRESWLKPDPARVAALRKEYRKRWPGKRIVGLSWKSARVMEGGATKNIDITDFARILGDRDSRFVNLQYGSIAADIAALRGAGLTLFVDDNIDPMKDIDGFAAQVAALDLVISTSNTTVHVAGALGVPCWLLLPRTRPLLWYWGYRGERTPWYPSLRLWRNASETSWDDLLADVGDALAALPRPE